MESVLEYLKENGVVVLDHTYTEKYIIVKIDNDATINKTTFKQVVQGDDHRLLVIEKSKISELLNSKQYEQVTEIFRSRV